MTPSKRDWTPGTFQVGVFVRTPFGTVHEMVTMKPASENCAAHALAAMYDLDARGIRRMRTAVRSDLAAVSKSKGKAK